MAEGNLRAGWTEIPSHSEKYSNFINSQDLIYAYVVAAFVDVVTVILIAVQQSPVSPSPVTIAQSKFSLCQTHALLFGC
jgi:tagatose-1,6-bisphosphate aldolase non-catalytic subunit AgaZ/GatZ